MAAVIGVNIGLMGINETVIAVVSRGSGSDGFGSIGFKVSFVCEMAEMIRSVGTRCCDCFYASCSLFSGGTHGGGWVLMVKVV